MWLLPSSANKIAYGDAACVLGIRPYATLASLDDLGYGMPYISIAAVYESLARATTVRND